ncbi:MAG: ricin-type beta-trefoil lectin domain protein [Proteobacteria bacterium]|nr:ricin-type beta-trefoil lectin domain protein [Pseudomonadota bacterium]
MNVRLMAILAFCPWGLASQAFATSASKAVDDLAQRCYAIQSPASGRYVTEYHSGGIINNGQNFAFYATDLTSASRFYFKPTSFKHFMLTNESGRYLATRLPAEPTAGVRAGKYAEWKITAIPHGGNQFRYRFRGTGLGRILRHNYNSHHFYFFDLLNPNNRNSETDFILVPTANCLPYPEVEVNVTGDVDQLKGNINAPVRGFIDPHTHITSYEFMGGKFMHGTPFHRWGVETALSDSSGIHGPWGSLDIIGNVYAHGDVNYRYDTRGWPDFPYWPTHKDMSHMGYYYKWIERAYLGGLRMMVSHVVENEVLCNIQATVNPASWINPNSCNTMDSIQLQIQRLYQMQDYIDAQAGGPNEGFFRIVTSPQQARQVVADGKLAVIIGIEASEIFNCGVQDGCTRYDVELRLLELYDRGVRALYPAHKFDNLLGGSRVEDGLINAGHWLSAGYFFDTEECDAETHGPHMRSGFPELGNIPVLGDILNLIAGNPQYNPDIEHCNQQGLTELGVYLVNRMIDMKMLIELDHASAKTASHILDIVEARNYSGVISAHSWMSRAKDGGLHNNMKRLIQAGGFVTPYNWETYSIADSISEYLDEVEKTPYLNGVSFATDMSGLGNQPGPRRDVQEKPLKYPYISEFGLIFDKQKTGNRIFDYNREGMAHFGMVADHLQDIRERAPARIYEAIMNSAEAYLQMWERAEANTSTAYQNPLPLHVRVVNRRSNRCADIPGDDDDLYDGQNVIQWDCQHHSSDQRWIYDESAQMLRNSVDTDLCLDSRQPWSGGNASIRWCEDSDNSRWTYDGYWLRSANNSNYVLDAYGSRANGDEIGLWRFHGGKNQAWELRSDREVYVWTTFRTHEGGRCLEVPGTDASRGTALKLGRCHGGNNQQWYYNPKDGSLRSGLDWNKCVDLRAASTRNDNAIILWDCHGGFNQQWDYDGGYFRSRMNSKKVIDANGNWDGADISIWDHHGGSNQRWRAVLN